MDALVNLLISLVCALPAVIAGLYFGLFMSCPSSNLPITVDTRSPWQPSIADNPISNNILVLMFFPIQHTLSLRGPLGGLLRLIIPKNHFTSFYVLSSGSSLGVVMLFWKPLLHPVWSVTNIHIGNTITILSVMCFLGVVVSILTLDPMAINIIGLKQPLTTLLGWKWEESKLVTTGVYGIVRHPAYTALILGLWITPYMTIGHLLLAIVFTIYILAAVKYSEEPALLREIGPAYRDYMNTTPAYIPSIM